MPERVLITGITGFAGSHLAERFVARGVAVHGLAFEDPPHPNLAQVVDRVVIQRGDITSTADIRAALDAARPDVVVHLAGQAVPTQAARDPVGAVRVNVLGTAALLSAIEERERLRVVVASSAEVYGEPTRTPVDEDTPTDPKNAYAATKLAAEAIAREVGARGRRAVVILRPMNQIGPRQHPALAASAFAKQIAEAEAGLVEPVIRHGSLDARRDFLDVRDMADAYARASDIETPGAHIFNVGTGHAVTIAEILSTLLDLARTKVRSELDRSLVRHTAPALALDASRLRARTGWAPTTDLRTSLGDLLDYWREQIRVGVRT